MGPTQTAHLALTILFCIQCGERFPRLHNFHKISAAAFRFFLVQNNLLQMLNQNSFDALRNLLQMTVQIDLLKTAGHRVVDGVHVAVSIR